MSTIFVEKNDKHFKNNLEIELIDDSNAPSYAMFNYFKTEPAMLLTTITSLITIVTVVLGFIANSIQKHYLSYWNISTDYVGYNTTNLIQQIGISIFISFSAIICITLLNVFYAKYFNTQMNDIQKKYVYKECKRNYNTIKLKYWFMYILSLFLKKTVIFHRFDFWMKLLEKCKRMLAINKGSVGLLEKQLEKAESIGSRKKQLASLRSLIIKLTLLTTAMFIVFFFFNMYVVGDSSYVIKTVLMTFVVMVVYSILGYLTARIKVPKKEIKDMVHKYLSGEAEWREFDYKNKYNKDNIKDYFTDDVLKGSLLMLGVFLVFFLAYFSVVSIQMPEEQKFFHTVEYQECTYVVLHTFDNKFVLEKAEETTDPETKETQIVIDISNHSIVSIDGLTVERHEYDIVKRKQ